MSVMSWCIIAAVLMTAIITYWEIKKNSSMAIDSDVFKNIFGDIYLRLM